MKLRLKYQKLFQIITFNDTHPSIKEIIQVAAEKFELNINSIEISLNANTYYSFESNGEEQFSLVNGDIIYVRLNGVYDDIKNIMKQEISGKMEDILSNCNMFYTADVVKKLSLPIHLFMTETGFHISEMDKSFVDIIFPPDTSSSVVSLSDGNILRLKYNYTSDTQATIYLTVNLIGNYICVYGSNPKKKNVYNYTFKKNEFILQNPINNPYYKADAIYKNISKLSTEFKNSIAVPLKIDIHLEFYITTHPFFQVLPYEILHHIFDYLDISSLFNLMQTCIRLNEAVRFCNRVWKKYFIKSFKKTLNLDFAESVNPEIEQDCYYKKFSFHHKERRLKRKACSGLTREHTELYCM